MLLLLFLFSGAVDAVAVSRLAIVSIYTHLLALAQCARGNQRRIRIFVLSHTRNAFSCHRALRHITHVLGSPPQAGTSDRDRKEAIQLFRRIVCASRPAPCRVSYHCRADLPDGKNRRSSGYDLIVFQSPDIAQKSEFTLN